MAASHDNAEADPLVVIFAGPNGSGKTSLIDELKVTGLATMRGTVRLPTRFINPDQLAKDLQDEYADQDARDEAAQRAAMRSRAEAIAAREPFAFETVMSHPSRISEMLLLKEQGYHVFLVFISTDDPEMNVARVTFRYQSGSTTGHYVKPEKVRERFHRTLALLPRAAEVADAVYIYDNSVEDKSATLQAVIERDAQFSVLPDAREWTMLRLVNVLRERERELDRLLAALEKASYPYGDTDELRGTYSGAVLSSTDFFLAQYDDATRQAVIHDRLMLETANHKPGQAAVAYAAGEHLTITYTPDGAPVTARQPAA